MALSPIGEFGYAHSIRKTFATPYDLPFPLAFLKEFLLKNDLEPVMNPTEL